jgi:hypothetical protein
MNKCNLESCTGTAVIEWESQMLSHIPREQRFDYIEQNAERLREQYCREVCPVARFNRKYHSQGTKPVSGNNLSQKIERDKTPDIYIYEGGINDNT